MREWVPGDVAMVKCSDGTWRRAICGEQKWGISVDEVWLFPDHAMRQVSESEARPLAVLDAEDIEAVREIWVKALLPLDQFQAALREFASPTPPKPDEPLGLGAVVEDADGERYVRHGTGGGGAVSKPSVTISHERTRRVVAKRRHSCWSWTEKCKAPGEGWDGQPGCTRQIDAGETYVESTIYPGHDSGYADDYYDRKGILRPGRPVTSRFCLPCSTRWVNLIRGLAALDAEVAQ